MALTTAMTLPSTGPLNRSMKKSASGRDSCVLPSRHRRGATKYMPIAEIDRYAGESAPTLPPNAMPEQAEEAEMQSDGPPAETTSATFGGSCGPAIVHSSSLRRAPSMTPSTPMAIRPDHDEDGERVHRVSVGRVGGVEGYAAVPLMAWPRRCAARRPCRRRTSRSQTRPMILEPYRCGPLTNGRNAGVIRNPRIGTAAMARASAAGFPGQVSATERFSVRGGAADRTVAFECRGHREQHLL